MEINYDEIRAIVQEELDEALVSVAPISEQPKAASRKKVSAQNTKRKTKMQFSKKLTLFISGVWLFILGFCLLFWVITREYPNEIFNAVTVPFVTILTSYFVKAGYENKPKIEGGAIEENEVY